MPDSAEEEVYWRQLLQLVRAGRVVPVVGSELLQIGEGELLYERLAKDLARELTLAEPHPATLHEVVCRYMGERRATSLSVIYSTLRELVEHGDYPLPEPIRKLAAITSFTVFLTTNFDDSITRALDAVRHGGTPKTRPIPHSLSYESDLPKELAEARGRVDPPIVFHLFGRALPFNEFAVTDEDLLEYVHALQSGEHRPEVLFRYVEDKHLLLVGTNFNDWLSRFFIRSAKRERLWMARRREDFIAGSTQVRDQSFTAFLENFSTGMKVFSLDPVAFVDKLHSRWLAQQPAEPAPAALNEEPPPTLRRMEPGSVFLSYASEDRGAADAIAEHLGKTGIDVWIDHAKLRVGELYADVITRNIRDAALFIALISVNSLQHQSFFRREWFDAIEESKERSDSPPYILLFSIDGTRVEANPDRFPPRFAKSHYEIAASGQLTEAQIKAVIAWFMEYESLQKVGQ